MGSEILVKELVDKELHLRFFDLYTVIRSDSGEFINLFAQMYRRFRVDSASSAALSTAEFVLITNPDNQWGKPVIILNGEVCPLSDAKLLEGYAYETILISIITRIHSHILIHAGVVSRNGRGIIVVADARHGKTTLVLELVRRGFRFLSDEMAALGRTDYKVHPFPRCLRVRPGTLELAGFPVAAVDARRWLGKLILDIEEIQPDSMGEVSSISHIVFLQDPLEDKTDTLNHKQDITILVDRLEETLLSGISQIEGVTEVEAGVDYGYPAIILRAIRTTYALLQIEALCKKHNILILDVVKGVEGSPAFDLPARLEVLPKSQAVVEILKRFQGGYKSELLQDEFGGSAARLFMELSSLINQANCYKLFVGRLNDMADLVCNMVSV